MTGVVIAVIVMAVGLVIGSIVFQKSYTTLDAMKDSDFSAEANATITGVGTDFWSGADLLRLLLIIVPASVILGALVFYLARGRGV